VIFLFIPPSIFPDRQWDLSLDRKYFIFLPHNLRDVPLKE
jgi:hypothetical protein